MHDEMCLGCGPWEPTTALQHNQYNDTIDGFQLYPTFRGHNNACGVVPILFGWFLRVPSLHALVFIRKTFCDFIYAHNKFVRFLRKAIMCDQMAVVQQPFHLERSSFFYLSVLTQCSASLPIFSTQLYRTQTLTLCLPEVKPRTMKTSTSHPCYS